MSFVKSVLVIVFALMSASVAADSRSISYASGEALRVQSVLVGVVDDLRYVQIDERSAWSQAAGTGIGATLGGLAGDQFGKGKGKTAMTIVMAALGGGIGNEVEQIMNTVDGIEFIVTLNDGRTIAVTQGLDKASSQIEPGDKVRIVEGENTRVVKLRSNSSTSGRQQDIQQISLDVQLQKQLLELRKEQALLREEQRRLMLIE